MIEQLDTIWQEINSVIATGAALPASVIITQAVTAEKFDIRNLIADRDINGTGGILLPVVVCRCHPEEAADWGMQNNAYSQQVDIYYIDRELNRIDTTVTTATIGATQPVASSAGMFVGQLLYFETNKVYRTVKSMPTTTSVELTATITTTLGEVVTSFLVKDVTVRTKIIKDLFVAGTAFTSFLVQSQGTIDVSDMGTVNSALMDRNMAAFAGAFSMEVVYGDSY
jgi:hypothetical protein